MHAKRKNILYSLALLFIILVAWLYTRQNTPKIIKIQGKTMGTTYHITYFDQQKRNFKKQIDSLLTRFNQSLSTYLPNSEITRYNQAKSLQYESPYLLPILEISKKITIASQGAFDPTVMPLVNAWGFGPREKIEPDSIKMDSLKRIIGFEKVLFNRDSVWKTDPRVQLDFSAVAKGYGVDIVAQFVSSRGIENVFVEIGGEVLAKGKNLLLDKVWEVGILNPDSSHRSQPYIAYAMLNNKAIATSGNYFNYYEKNGKKYTHTINPKSGYPSQHNMLSASVLAGDCATADAWATAFMVMGSCRAVELLKQHSGELDALLIYSTEDGLTTFMTENAGSFITVNR